MAVVFLIPVFPLTSHLLHFFMLLSKSSLINRTGFPGYYICLQQNGIITLPGSIVSLIMQERRQTAGRCLVPYEIR
ncbi:hypothetical protein FHX64_001771 [Microbacter margulisiae]|uniref:Uncharacterized protein n=1 Tax=Microbacter margulisiae TaxID=1350067 RepID=A0A7W5H1H9_9PORP|nr:hypothetical protein [Microbacter margulisiae]